MNKHAVKRKIIWWIFGILSVLVGLYPLIYVFIEDNFGLLSTKPDALLTNILWQTAFNGHITFGGIALLVGWVQFSSKLRQQYIQLHKTIGKIYVMSVLISGICGIYVGYYATGNWISKSGFMILGIFWITVTYLGYKTIVNRKVQSHLKYMAYSYAACFAAVTLRIWLPLLTIVLNDFLLSYKIVAWLSWVPNLVFAKYYLNRKSKSNPEISLPTD